MRTATIFAFLVFAALTSFRAALSATIIVPDDYQGIQDAICAAIDGDEIVVRPGTYFENVDFLGKAIWVRSESGYEVTTIDGSKNGSVITFDSGEGLESVLEGFTITNGTGTLYSWGTCGGGINCNETSPTIYNNNIIANSVDNDGGGIYCRSSLCVIMGNIIESNSSFIGGGICTTYGTPEIVFNNILENTAFYGGGVVAAQNNPTIEQNTIDVNLAYFEGGGVYCQKTLQDTKVNHNRICYNFSNKGGGISCDQCSPEIINNLIRGNTAEDYGGGIYCYKASAFICNDTIIDNVAVGGAFCYGGGIYSTRRNRKSEVIVVNSILYWNDAVVGPEIYIGSSYDPSSLRISYSNLSGGQNSVYVSSGCTLNWGSGMIDSDPTFVNTAGEDTHLTYDSPCRNSGTNTAVTESCDIEGDPRVVAGTVDIGADEYYLHLYHSGDVIPGGAFDINVVGIPYASVILALGAGIQDPPQVTLFGDLYLDWPIQQFNIGTIPSDGVLIFLATVPSFWIPGDEKPLQALMGPITNPNSMLSNLMVLEVE